MAEILHILTRPDDALAAEVIARQRVGGHDLEVMDLTEVKPDYAELLEKIFESESIQTW